MGDRSNIFIQQNKQETKYNGETPLPAEWSGVGLYSHWHGESLHAVGFAAAVTALPRLGDPSYFARRVLHLTLQAVDPECSETGFGIWTDHPDDNEYPILVINGQTGTCWFSDADSYMNDPDTHDGDSGILSHHGELYDFDVVNVRDGIMPVYTEINVGTDEEQDADEDA
jgi:hypothetical protein